MPPNESWAFWRVSETLASTIFPSAALYGRETSDEAMQRRMEVPT